jgi:hypothetical protein
MIMVIQRIQTAVVKVMKGGKVGSSRRREQVVFRSKKVDSGGMSRLEDAKQSQWHSHGRSILA